MASFRDIALTSKAWPFEEARRLVKRFEKNPPPKGYALFETGYGPSGLPHIGTFGEVTRTVIVQHAFETISDIPTRLISFSDDMDGLRKVPTNVPMQAELAKYLNLPLTKVRDPFEQYESFAHHNNAKLCEFLDMFGFEYELASSTEYYRSGKFDEMLLIALERFDKIMNVMLPTLGEERRKSYSPFLPISPKTGHVLQVPTLARNIKAGTIIYREPDGEEIEIPVTGGNIKLQWKADWAMRWAALGVDYEMSGKDLIDSVTQANKICRIFGSSPPENLTYELFNDVNGQKISKSKGNGLSIAEWLRYGTSESLSYFMYLKPKAAKRLYFDVIPKSVDDYHQHLRAFETQDNAQRLTNPVYHIHAGKPPVSDMPISFSMMLNLASVSSAENTEQLWGFITRYAPDCSPKTTPSFDVMVEAAIRYYQDFVKPQKRFRLPNEQEKNALKDLAKRLGEWKDETDSEALQTMVYAVGKEHEFEPLKMWFSALYEVLLGTAQGPRFGGFIALYGIRETRNLIEKALNSDVCSG